jgi:hypothetical protein
LQSAARGFNPAGKLHPLPPEHGRLMKIGHFVL